MTAAKKKAKPIAILTAKVYDDKIEAHIEGFDGLGRRRLERGVKAIYKEYHMQKKVRVFGERKDPVDMPKQDIEKEGLKKEVKEEIVDVS